MPCSIRQSCCKKSRNACASVFPCDLAIRIQKYNYLMTLHIQIIFHLCPPMKTSWILWTEANAPRMFSACCNCKETQISNSCSMRTNEDQWCSYLIPLARGMFLITGFLEVEETYRYCRILIKKATSASVLYIIQNCCTLHPRHGWGDLEPFGHCVLSFY